MGTYIRASLLILVAFFCITVESVELEDGFIRVRQHTTVRRKRSAEPTNEVKFKKEMKFSLDAGHHVIDLTLNQVSNFNYHSKVVDALTGELEMYHWAYTGIYEEPATGAVFTVSCRDGTTCTLTGSFYLDGKRYLLDEPKNDDNGEFHRVRRSVKNHQDMVLQIHADGTAEVHKDTERSKISVVESQKLTRAGRDTRPSRSKRATPDCAMVEVSFIVDSTMQAYFLQENNNILLDAQTALDNYIERMTAEANLRFAQFGTDMNCCNECLKVYSKEILLQQAANSWSKDTYAETNFFLLGTNYVKCETAMAELTQPTDFTVCLTGNDIATNLPGDGLNVYHSFPKTYNTKQICDGTTKAGGIMEFKSDQPDALLAHLVGHGLSAVHDEDTTCKNAKLSFIMDYDVHESEPDKNDQYWKFSKCSCDAICAKLPTYKTTCLDKADVADANWDNFMTRTSVGFRGLVYDPASQCKLVYPTSTGLCTTTDLSTICASGYGCDVAGTNCSCKIRVPSGTTCGSGKWCDKGVCVCAPAALTKPCCTTAKCTVTGSICIDKSTVKACLLSPTQTCTAGQCVPDATCDAGKCKCNTNFISDGTKCVPAIAPGGNCANGICSDANSVCKCNICECKPGYVNVGGTCKLGDCTMDAQCLGANERCASNFCQCKDGFYLATDGLCKAELCLGVACTSSCQCGPDSSICDSKTKKCVCQPDFVPQTTTPCGVCIAKVKVTDGCSTTPDNCQENAFCDTTPTPDSCKCNPGFEADAAGTCLKSSGNNGASCADECDCNEKGAKCIGNTCQCPAGTARIAGACYGQGLGDFCDTANALTCTVGTCGADKTCSCPSPEFEYAGACYKGTLNSKCSCLTTEACKYTCPVTNGECTVGGTCTCKNGYTANALGGCDGAALDATCSTGSCVSCLASCAAGTSKCTCDAPYTAVAGKCWGLKLGFPCDGTNAATCTEGTCSGGVCSCPTGWFSYKGKCYAGTLNSDCDNAAPLATCPLQNQKCVGGKCVCPAPYSVVSNGCWGLKSGFPCDTANALTCTGGATCVGGVCQCPANTKLENGDCVAILGVACSATVKCIDPNAECDTVCKCKATFVDTNTAATLDGCCVQSDLGLGNICDTTCATTNSECKANKICGCIDGFKQVGAACLPGLTTSCAGGLTCADCGAVCKAADSTCGCEDPYVLVGTKCVLKPGLGGTCSGTLTCMDPNADCIGTVCKCKANFADSNSQATAGGVCLATEGKVCNPCDESTTCGTNMACVMGQCKCNTGFIPIDDVCVKGDVTDKCLANPDTCTQFGSSCVAGICTCTAPATYDAASKKCSSTLGGVCGALSNCKDTNAECVSSSDICDTTCQCKTGFVPSITTADKQVCDKNCVAQVAIDGECDPTILNICQTPNAHCPLGTCACQPGFTRTGADCTKAPKDLGDACTCDDVCQPEDKAFCNAATNKCECRSSYKEVDEGAGPICKLAVGFGGACLATNSCGVTDGSIDCRKSDTGGGGKICQCDRKYEEDPLNPGTCILK